MRTRGPFLSWENLVSASTLARPFRMEIGASFTSIPVIDIEPLVRMRKDSQSLDHPKVVNVVKELDEACKNVGFFYVIGHGVSLDLINGVREIGREFFSLPREDKLQIGMSSTTGYRQQHPEETCALLEERSAVTINHSLFGEGRGYQKVGENITKGVPDLHEAIDYFRDWNGMLPSPLAGHPLCGRNQWPDTPHGFRPLLEQYLQVIQDLGRTIMQGIGLALNGSTETFEGKRAGDPFWVLRMIGYPPIAEQKVEDIGCGEHTDYGLLTLVNQDDNVQALQVKNQAGEWIWANPVPGTFVVNIGDMLKIWSNGMYLPTVHRVVNNNSMYRVSVPFFYEPNFDALVEPLEMCKEKTGGRSKYDALVYGDHFTRKVLTNFG